MRLSIDHDRCTGHGRCYALAPDLFDVDPDGYGEVRGSGELTPSNLDPARRAEANCPERAVVVQPAPVLTPEPKEQP